MANCSTKFFHRQISICILFFLFCQQFCFAQTDQTHPVNLESYQQLYPTENAVCLYNAESYSINYSENGSLEIEKKSSEDLLILNAVAAGNYSVRSINYSTSNELENVNAYSLIPTKNSYLTKKVEHFTDEKSMDNSIFYDDEMKRSLLFPALVQGARTVMNYTIHINDAHLLQPFYFCTFAPTELSVCTYLIPNDVEIGYRLFNIDSNKIVFTKTLKGKFTEYRWQMKNVAKQFTEDGAVNFRNYLPHLIVFIKSYHNNTNAVQLLNDTDALYHWYFGFIKNLNTVPDSSLKALVDSITQNQTSNIDKVKTIYYWVQDHIQYVAFENGLEGFIPRQASLIYQRRYGDCKDMASIITAMLHAANIPAYLTWIGTRDLPYTYENLPSPLCDNHMIASIYNDSTFIFLDGTADDLPYGYPSSFILGKQALISLDSATYKIVHVPIPDASKSFRTDSITININSNSIEAHAISHWFGYAKHFFLYDLNATKPTDLQKLMNETLQMGSNKFQTTAFQISGNKDRNENLSIQYDFEIPDYVTKVGDEIFINLQLNKLWYNASIDTAVLKLARENDYPFIRSSILTLNIPEGYHIEHLPVSSSFHDLDFGYNFIYNANENKIVLEQNFQMNYLQLPSAKFNIWNNMISQLSKADNDLIILKKN